MKAVSLSLSRLESDLKMAGRASSTIQQYLSSIRRFHECLGRDLADAEQEDIRRWVEHLQGQPIGAQRLRCHYSALTFLYRKTLGRPELVSFISMPREEPPLRVILTKDEVRRVLGGFTVAKYRVFFGLIYATGLRISEAAALEVHDIDRVGGVIRVRHGKGGRERLVMMSPRLHQTLREHWWNEGPADPWLFATDRGTPLCHETARRALLCASACSGICHAPDGAGRRHAPAPGAPGPWQHPVHHDLYPRFGPPDRRDPKPLRGLYAVADGLPQTSIRHR
jgi:integrase/recombinase XerD